MLNDKLFQLIFNQIQSPISILKADPPKFTLLAFNSQYEQSTKTPTNAIIGKSAFDIYKPWDTESAHQFELLKNGLIEAINQKTAIKLPVLCFEVRYPEETEVKKSWWQIEITPILLNNSEVGYLLCNTNNVTQQELNRISIAAGEEKERLLNDELKNVNEELLSTIEELGQSQIKLNRFNSELELQIANRTRALAESEKRAKAMLDALPQIAWTSSLKGGVDFFNRKWYDYTGLSFEETKAWGWKVVIHPDDLDHNLNSLNTIISGNGPGEFEVREKGKDGVYRWHLCRMQPLCDENGEISHWIGTATDIDALKQLQQQKDDFISIASHELKTPITALKASIQLLDRMKYDPHKEVLPKLISQARNSMQKISQLIDDLLNLGRLQQKELKMNVTSFIISELLNNCCNPINLMGKQSVTILGDKTLTIQADKDQIEQVIINFLNNAVKYAPESETISILIEKIGFTAKVSVVDKGKGIPADKLKHLFDRYYKVNSTDYNNSGLGLGLFICYEIIKRHGGEIGVESELGAGSTFWFKVPIYAINSTEKII